MLFFKDLYTNVLEDSVIFSIEEYQIEFRNHDYGSESNGKKGVFLLNITSKEMEKLNGFKVHSSRLGLIRKNVSKVVNINFNEFVFKKS